MQENIGVPRYPLDKDAAGSKWWGVMHSIAAEYPDSPSEQRKEEDAEGIRWLNRRFVCPKCVSHGEQHLSEDPIENHMDNRKEFSGYLCDWHNAIRQRQKKKLIPCNNILLPIEGDKSTTDGFSSTTVSSSEVYPSVAVSMDSYKRASERVLRELCKRDNLPPPKIIFDKCPDKPDHSCVIYTVDEKGKPTTKPVIYLNPVNTGIRTILHEYRHYRARMKGHKDLASDEYEIDREAIAQLEKEFPYDHDRESNKSQRDSSNAETYGFETKLSETITKEPKTAEAKPPVTAQEKPKASAKSWLDRFPSYKKVLERTPLKIKEKYTYPSYTGGESLYDRYISERDRKRKEKELSEAVHNSGSGSNKDGIAASIEGAYAPLTKPLKVSERDLNESYTPEFVGTSLQTIAESTMSPFGSLVATTISGLGLQAATSVEGLPQGDRKAMSEIAAHLISNGIRYMNPRMSKGILADAQRFGNALATLDAEQMVGVLMGTGGLFGFGKGGFDDGTGGGGLSPDMIAPPIEIENFETGAQGDLIPRPHHIPDQSYLPMFNPNARPAAAPRRAAAAYSRMHIPESGSYIPQFTSGSARIPDPPRRHHLVMGAGFPDVFAYATAVVKATAAVISKAVTVPTNIASMPTGSAGDVRLHTQLQAQGFIVPPPGSPADARVHAYLNRYPGQQVYLPAVSPATRSTGGPGGTPAVLPGTPSSVSTPASRISGGGGAAPTTTSSAPAPADATAPPPLSATPSSPASSPIISGTPTALTPSPSATGNQIPPTDITGNPTSPTPASAPGPDPNAPPPGIPPGAPPSTLIAGVRSAQAPAVAAAGGGALTTQAVQILSTLSPGSLISAGASPEAQATILKSGGTSTDVTRLLANADATTAAQVVGALQQTNPSLAASLSKIFALPPGQGRLQQLQSSGELTEAFRVQQESRLSQLQIAARYQGKQQQQISAAYLQQMATAIRAQLDNLVDYIAAGAQSTDPRLRELRRRLILQEAQRRANLIAATGQPVTQQQGQQLVLQATRDIDTAIATGVAQVRRTGRRTGGTVASGGGARAGVVEGVNSEGYYVGR